MAIVSPGDLSVIVEQTLFENLNPSTEPELRNDYEDTQMGIQVRDRLVGIAAEDRIQLVFHGCAIPGGERRRWPHLLGTEAIKGQEGNPAPPHDNCIAYIRNPLGPVDYSPVWFGKGNKTDAYQLSTSVIFESGFLIFADLDKDYLNHPAKEFLKRVPATWDEVRFVEGYPASHTVIARGKGDEWYVGAMTVNSRSVDLPLEFQHGKGSYRATIFKDRETGQALDIETRELGRSDTLKLAMQDRGGFVVHLAPLPDK